MCQKFRRKWHRNVRERDLRPVRCMPLSELLPPFTRHIDMMSLDVEGGEFEVMKTFPWDRVTLSVLFAEAKGFNPEKDGQLVKLMRSHGYLYEGKLHKSDWFVAPSFLKYVRGLRR
jgi:hypothetical protein